MIGEEAGKCTEHEWKNYACVRCNVLRGAWFIKDADSPYKIGALTYDGGTEGYVRLRLIEAKSIRDALTAAIDEAERSAG